MKKQIIWTISGLMLATALSGCATAYGDLRAKTPYETHIYASNAETLSDCALNTFSMAYSMHYNLTFTRIKDGPTIHLEAQLGEFFGGGSAWDIAFIPFAPDQTKVEVRSDAVSIWGTPNYPADLWTRVQGCTKST